MKLAKLEIEAALWRAFADLPQATRDEVVFHMTDWLEDLQALAAAFARAAELPAEELHDVVLDFLTHAPHHLAAAAVLVTGLPVTDVFGVGAVEVEQGRSEKS